ncbi:uncharacterized protein SPPG_01194 [Spizellomyces punctatus DAOM BR117]|uniref:Uncharacterized protein n=1 Tax=Spizellomyces punctatus (strain DAOM BR117) TaxID=645134 RepID=A0A0L0HQS6_SPIPD|nr:uncharacterized protein SPPG_01194 [Spizellomyces punctatus DAOM BR117]KND03736.1 hypothetical protein SPPG_01194 [Spizellomyces punctatus DAOM BR117]|eukprot:XP_016611775.1 hypothetical protein SPPG_01194 [Spizellomyces punctatus DAOM BR117]
MRQEDAREEALREAAAVGNAKVVQHYLTAGVNVDAQNRVNKWTALHWAAQRSHPDIVRILLDHGADTDLQNTKGQKAADIAKGAEVRQLLNVSPEEESVEESNTPKFVPSYLAAPAFDTLYSVPLDQQPSFASSAATPVQSSPVSNRPPPPVDQAPVQAKISETEKELLVYRSTRDESNLLGAIFVPSSSTLSDTVTQIKNEIDDIASEFTLRRHTGTHSIPINSKQMQARTLQHFHGNDDAVVILYSEP